MPRQPIPSDAVLARAAELRAGGSNWEAVAAKLNRSAETVRKWPALHPERWQAALHQAERRLVAEASAESVLILRQLLRSDDEKVRRDAAEFLVELRLTLAKLDDKSHLEHSTNALTSDSARFAAYLQGHSDEELDRLVAELQQATIEEPADPGPQPYTGSA